VLSYILSFNPFSTTPSVGQILNHLQVNKYVSGFYSPFPGTYLLKSPQTIDVLNNSFLGLFESAPYTIMMISGATAQGSLPQEIWAWVNYGAVPPAPPPPTTQGNALLGLLGR
jgi:hypothetical protein